MHCCEQMGRTIIDAETGLIYVAKWDEYGLQIQDGGSSFLLLRFCPWCGVKLGVSKRDEWFEAVEASGLDPYSSELPQHFLSSAWFENRSLLETRVRNDG